MEVRSASGTSQGDATNELCSFDWLAGPRNVAKSSNYTHPLLTLRRLINIALFSGPVSDTGVVFVRIDDDLAAPNRMRILVLHIDEI